MIPDQKPAAQAAGEGADPAAAGQNPPVENAAATPNGPQIAGQKPPSGNMDQSVATVIDKDYVKINGFAYNNIILGEFISMLQATEHQDADANDPRTLIYFSKIVLSYAKSTDPHVNQGNRRGAEGAAADPPKIVEFQLLVPYNERHVQDQPLNEKLSRMIEAKAKRNF
jgi:hypothetical protein